MFSVVFYKNERGEKPALEFILSIKDAKLKAKAFRSLKLLETFGNKLGEPDTAPLRDGIFELRTIQGNNIVRTLYFYHKNSIVVVTNSFIKKTKKTPSRDIRTALERKEKYERGKN
ncbi:MAG: type II toxin-antitoxin system RelE/ParE family toxin [Erysipelotrichaceae bacterium]|nr:type II toxin-antitoxin system RelE/ParE family toxin [Erysipelotrichaceae bacterium]